MRQNSIFILCLVVFFSCSKPIPRKPVSYSSSTFLSESVKRNKQINTLQKEAIQKYISLDSSSNYYTSTNGFWYKYLKKVNDDIAKPKMGDRVEFEYSISDLNNKILYSMNDLGLSSYTIDKEDFEYGVQYGLKLMKEGEEMLFLFPSFSAFGYAGDQEKIGVNQPLIYKVKLIKINK